MLQCEVLWPLKSNSKVLGVPIDSQVPISGVWKSSSHSSNNKVAINAISNYSPFVACGVRFNLIDPIEGVIGGGLCRHMVLTHGNWEWHWGLYWACINKIQNKKMHISKCSNLINYNYILCNLRIGPWAFNIDMGLRWNSKIFKMKSYGHSQSYSGWQKHWGWKFIVPMGTTCTIVRDSSWNSMDFNRVLVIFHNKHGIQNGITWITRDF
jgi:hypothetical protein